jgi:hypothetical protein
MQTDARLFEILKKNPRRAIYSSFFWNTRGLLFLCGIKL